MRTGLLSGRTVCYVSHMDATITTTTTATGQVLLSAPYAVFIRCSRARQGR